MDKGRVKESKRMANLRHLKEIDYPQIIAYRLQEIFMEYFKDINPQKLSRVRRIHLRNLPIDESGPFQYVRDLERRRIPHRVYVDNVPLCDIAKFPHQVKWHTATTDRSDEFKALHSKLEHFFNTYLPGVERTENGHRGLGRHS